MEKKEKGRASALPCGSEPHRGGVDPVLQHRSSCPLPCLVVLQAEPRLVGSDQLVGQSGVEVVPALAGVVAQRRERQRATLVRIDEVGEAEHAVGGGHAVAPAGDLEGCSLLAPFIVLLEVSFEKYN